MITLPTNLGGYQGAGIFLPMGAFMPAATPKNIRHTNKWCSINTNSPGYVGKNNIKKCSEKNK